MFHGVFECGAGGAGNGDDVLEALETVDSEIVINIFLCAVAPVEIDEMTVASGFAERGGEFAGIERREIRRIIEEREPSGKIAGGHCDGFELGILGNDGFEFGIAPGNMQLKQHAEFRIRKVFAEKVAFGTSTEIHFELTGELFLFFHLSGASRKPEMIAASSSGASSVR